jgi:hypothetical protein
MTDNKILPAVHAEDEQVIEWAQNRLKKAHSRKKRGGWRAVASDLDLNVRYVHELAVDGVVPSDPEKRHKLGLPRVLPSERKPKAKREPVKIGVEGWENVYFKKVKK